MSDELLLHAQGLNKQFGAVVAAQDVNVRVKTGERVSLIGSNGAGKTTFVNMITGYVRADSGSIWLGGTDISRMNLDKSPAWVLHVRFKYRSSTRA